MPPFKSLTGLVAAPFTPFTPEGALRLEVVRTQAVMLARYGVRAAFVCGTTGEGAKLSTAERMTLLEAWLQARPPELAIIAHVGHPALAEAVALARHAADHGVDAFAATAPTFFKPGSIDELVDWCAQLAAAAAPVPFYYYYIPAMTGHAHSVTEFVTRAVERIPSLVGVKFTDENLADYVTAAAVAPERCQLLFGRDELYLAGLALGAGVAVGSTYNYMAPLYQAIETAFRAGRLAEARDHQLTATRIIAVLQRFGGHPAGKMAMALAGIDCGPVRPPATPWSAERNAAFRSEMESAGFLAWCHRQP
jgi:N-acetylneuraminate lyase